MNKNLLANLNFSKYRFLSFPIYHMALAPTYTNYERSKDGKGLFTALPSNLCAFIPAHTFAESEDLARWKSQARLEASSPDVFANTPESVKRGIQKQYEQLAKWVDDPTAPMAQWVFFLPPK